MKILLIAAAFIISLAACKKEEPKEPDPVVPEKPISFLGGTKWKSLKGDVITEFSEDSLYSTSGSAGTTVCDYTMTSDTVMTYTVRWYVIKGKYSKYGDWKTGPTYKLFITADSLHQRDYNEGEVFGKKALWGIRIK